MEEVFATWRHYQGLREWRELTFLRRICGHWARLPASCVLSRVISTWLHHREFGLYRMLAGMSIRSQLVICDLLSGRSAPSVSTWLIWPTWRYTFILIHRILRTCLRVGKFYSQASGRRWISIRSMESSARTRYPYQTFHVIVMKESTAENYGEENDSASSTKMIMTSNV